MRVGKLNPLGKINFPGFQEILDFTSAGSESSTSVTVDGDTDKEYICVVRSLTAGDILMRLNNDSTSGKYGRQYIYNNAGTISAGRATATEWGISPAWVGMAVINLLTPTGFLKTCFRSYLDYTSGTTISHTFQDGYVFNSTSNVTSLDFLAGSGNFTSGTRIVVYARRSQS
jgi:hypothetical protein